MTYHRHYLSLSQTRQIYNKHRILEFNFVSLMWKEEESFPSINLSTTLQPHTHTRFYICWHSDKSHTEFKHLPWTIQAICRKNPSDWNPRVPSPVPSSLGITLELIHNTYAWAQKAWDGKKKTKLFYNDIHTRTTKAALSGRIWCSMSRNRCWCWEGQCEPNFFQSPNHF